MRKGRREDRTKEEREEMRERGKKGGIREEGRKVGHVDREISGLGGWG